MEKTPKSMRLHIGIFGRTNVGKSSLINILTHQETSIVSSVAGTTTDAVEKSMEMLPLGPVVFIDTAGIDDTTELGEKRTEKTEKIIARCDVAIIVSDFNGWTKYETELAKTFKENSVPILAVINKSDVSKISEEKLREISAFADKIEEISAKKDKDIPSRIRETLIRCVPEEFINPPAILENLVNPEDVVVLVTPIDKEAPKGRLILPQVNVLRELLDNRCISVVTTEKTLDKSLKSLKNPPKLVITDSQAFKQVSEIVPKSVPLTSFSILFARLKGDIKEFSDGVRAIADLKDGDKILICESCTHHAIEDDIARVKIPKLVRNKTGKDLIFEQISSHEFPKNIRNYALIIHCGGCMTNRREILSRIAKAKEAKIPITNYGIAISYCLGILDRAIQPLN
ncbi:MAG: [FeFe] hydrogenase H-cluster maturation GTPase HydF [Candidatus Gastranaerophilaceae bacterium]